ncbi:MAG: hypothetical protein ACRCZF_26050, partial [Gemmataceae bacterium]
MMNRKLWTVLLGAGLSATAFGQTSTTPAPKATKVPPATPPTVSVPLPSVAKPEPPESELDAAIRQALAIHPDIRLAELEVQTAQAKLDQTKMKIAQTVAAAVAARDVELSQLKLSEQSYMELQKLQNQGLAPQGELLTARVKHEQSRVRLEVAERALKSMISTPKIAMLNAGVSSMQGGASSLFRPSDPTKSAEEQIRAIQSQAERYALMLEKMHTEKDIVLGSMPSKSAAVRPATLSAVGPFTGQFIDVAQNMVTLKATEGSPQEILEKLMKNAGIQRAQVRVSLPAVRQNGKEVDSKPIFVTLPEGELSLAAWVEQ